MEWLRRPDLRCDDPRRLTQADGFSPAGATNGRRGPPGGTWSAPGRAQNPTHDPIARALPVTTATVPLPVLACLSVLTALLLMATDAKGQNVVELFRERVEAARRLSVPKPPAGVRELQWHALSPPGWDPGKFLKQLNIANLQDSDPRAAQAAAQIRAEWDSAPAVTFTDDAPVRLTGFPVMLDPGEGLSKTILLVPYYGACVHRPAPPANQMVLVVLKSGLPRNMASQPIWITGRIYPLRVPTVHGKVAYSMPEATWTKYPQEKYPMPQYVPLR